MTRAVAPRAPRRGLVLFAFGDFAFNLYWQSVMLFLMFYYTEAVELPVEVAALTYMAASIWDGIVNFAAGIFVDGRRGPRGLRHWLLLGSAPLGLAFVLAYAPPWPGWWAAATVFVGHLLFRTAYAFVNVPYLAMSARISLDSRERSLIAGLRMLFGTLALFVVTQGTRPLGTWLSASPGSPRVYFAAAAAFALAGTVILMLVGGKVREIVPTGREARPSLRDCLASLARNRAFVTLSAATMAMIVASAILTKSVLYYYKYALGDEVAGTAALGWMGAAGAVAVVFWTLGCRRFGARWAWFAAVAMGCLLLAAFAIHPVRTIPVMHAFLIAVQAVITGLNIAFWAMLPNTIEYGERATGLRVEGTAFGLAALLQRIAIGAATGLLGLILGVAGYAANMPQAPATLEAMRLTLALVPLAFLLLSGGFMLLNPLKRGAHAEIVEELARRRGIP